MRRELRSEGSEETKSGSLSQNDAVDLKKKRVEKAVCLLLPYPSSYWMRWTIGIPRTRRGKYLWDEDPG